MRKRMYELDDEDVNRTCSYCKGNNVNRRGSYKIKNETIIKTRYVCMDCGFNFYTSKPVDENKNTENNDDSDLVMSNMKLAARNQSLMDERRVSNKSWRHQTRMTNFLEEFSEYIKESFKQYDYKIDSSKIIHKISDPLIVDNIGVLHITDAHFGEWIEIDSNKYNFDVASKRLKKFVDESIIFLEAKNVKNVIVALTGDIFNSNRRLDEVMNQASNRSNALFLGTKLIEYVILHLNKRFSSVHIASISGNESRLEKETGWSDSMMSDNFDFILFNILKYKFANYDNIKFIKGNPVELVININDTNMLLMHGNQIGQNVTKEVQQIIAKYSARKIRIDYVIFGHLHQAYISDFFSRGSSLCGGNAYSDKGLNLASKASQNLYIVGKNNEIICIRIDLQNVDNIIGYDIEDVLQEYETKSIDKLNSKYGETILKIII